jgi:hypothetical protein
MLPISVFNNVVQSVSRGSYTRVITRNMWRHIEATRNFFVQGDATDAW